ncbi:MAG: hypothetical protein JWP27_948 [Flaviaesturariibacter sp.]|nr:hypothetical protein [Flaviaesturariibacter sp.]
MAAVLMGTLAVKAQDVKIDDAVKVNTEKYDFGKIKQGVPVSTYFEITNTTSKPLVIAGATGSCGCTTPEVPKEPIAPGATTKLKVNYNAAAMGVFNKTVTINFAGISQPKIVAITGETLEATAYDAYAADAKKSDAAKATDKSTKTKVKTGDKKVKTKATVKA